MAGKRLCNACESGQCSGHQARYADAPRRSPITSEMRHVNQPRKASRNYVCPCENHGPTTK